jgi:hypothetical protein
MVDRFGRFDHAALVNAETWTYAACVRRSTKRRTVPVGGGFPLATIRRAI